MLLFSLCSIDSQRPTPFASEGNGKRRVIKLFFMCVMPGGGLVKGIAIVTITWTTAPVSSRPRNVQLASYLFTA